jgi:hypothetical protein
MNLMTKKTVMVMLAVALGVAGVLSSCSDSGMEAASQPVIPADPGQTFGK